MLSVMPLSPQTPPRSSRMSWRSSMGMASSRGTTLNRYGPVPSSLPACCWHLLASLSPAPAAKSSQEKADLSVRPPASPHGRAPRTGKDAPRDGEHLSQPPTTSSPGHPGDQACRTAIPPHPTDAPRTPWLHCCPVLAAGSLAESVLGHLLARQKPGGIYFLFPQKQMILLLPMQGQGKALCLLAFAWGRLGLFFLSGAFRETY